MSKVFWVIGLVTLLSIASAVYYYPYLPELMASHWNAQGVVDGYLPKFWALAILPLLSLVFSLLLIFIPKADPLKANIAAFKNHFEIFIIIFDLFLFYLYLLTLAWGLGIRFAFTSAVVPALAAVIFAAGVLMGKTRRNYSIGFRTPWALADDSVWEKTNRLGGRLFKWSAAVGLLGLVFTKYAFGIVIGPVLIASIVTTISSYLEYRKRLTGSG